ncbi:hypothetical protein ACQUZK_10340, partial [Streptococcus pyogenes]|uniref:hypothetical protein n=1 Tax=Streptococcus pyogenes TaxID=1314 RepID=UPI003D9FD3E0
PTSGPTAAGGEQAPDATGVDRTERTLDLTALGLVVTPLDVPADLGWSSTVRNVELTSNRPPDGAQAGFRLSGRLSDLT